MVIRVIWVMTRLYKSGHRKICGINLPDGMKVNDKFERPITPSTKADQVPTMKIFPRKK